MEGRPLAFVWRMSQISFLRSWLRRSQERQAARVRTSRVSPISIAARDGMGLVLTVVAGRRAARRGAECERLERDRAAAEAARASGTLTTGGGHGHPGATGVRRSPPRAKARA